MSDILIIDDDATFNGVLTRALARRGLAAVGVTDAAAHTGQIAREVLGAARDLGEQANTLDREVDRFIATVRAA